MGMTPNGLKESSLQRAQLLLTSCRPLRALPSVHAVKIRGCPSSLFVDSVVDVASSIDLKHATTTCSNQKKLFAAQSAYNTVPVFTKGLCAAGNQATGLLPTVERVVGVGGQQGGLAGAGGKRFLLRFCLVAPTARP